LSTHDEDYEEDKDRVEANVNETEYAKRNLIGNHGLRSVKVGGHCVDDGVPNTDAAQDGHRRQDILILKQHDIRIRAQRIRDKPIQSKSVVTHVSYGTIHKFIGSNLNFSDR